MDSPTEWSDPNYTPFIILQNLKDDLAKLISDVICSLVDFLDELKGSSEKIISISRDLARTNVFFAMNLNEFGQDLKMLHNYYSRIYIKTKGMVEFGCSPDLIPYYQELIENKDNLRANKEIKSFLDILTRRIKEIVDEVGADSQSEQLNDEVIKLIANQQKCDQKLKESLKAYKIGRKTILFNNSGERGTFLCGGHPHEVLALASNHANEILYFVMPQGVKALKAAGDTAGIIQDHAQCVRNRFIEFTTKVANIRTHLNIIVENIERLLITRHNNKELNTLKAAEKSSAELKNIAVILNELCDVFTHLDKEVIEKKTPWKV